MANITVSMTTDVEMVIIDTIGSQGSSFEVTVCASYNGRGLDNRPLGEFPCFQCGEGGRGTLSISGSKGL